MRKKKILEMYEFEKNKFVINVSTNNIEDLYNVFDNTASYIKRDLNREFVDYLIDCVDDLGKYDFIIKIHIEKDKPNKLNENKILQSRTNYFNYLIHIEKRDIERLFSSSIVYLGIAVVFIVISLLTHTDKISSLFQKVVLEGITIAAWLSTWKVLGDMIYNWIPHYKNIKMYERIIKSELIFEYKKKLKKI